MNDVRARLGMGDIADGSKGTVWPSIFVNRQIGCCRGWSRLPKAEPEVENAGRLEPLCLLLRRVWKECVDTAVRKRGQLLDTVALLTRKVSPMQMILHASFLLLLQPAASAPYRHDAWHPETTAAQHHGCLGRKDG